MKVKDLLSSKDKWTRHACFRDRHGRITHEPSEAHSYCLVGAILVCYKDPKPIFAKINAEVGHYFPSHWNDARRYEDVKALVDHLDI